MSHYASFVALTLSVADRRASSSNSLLFQTEGIHDQRKPGSLRFTTLEGRREFIETVVYAVQPPKILEDMAGIVAERMRRLTHGRAWQSCHMRRGDFLLIDWAP